MLVPVLRLRTHVFQENPWAPSDSRPLVDVEDRVVRKDQDTTLPYPLLKLPCAFLAQLAPLIQDYEAPNELQVRKVICKFSNILLDLSVREIPVGVLKIRSFQLNHATESTRTSLVVGPSRMRIIPRDGMNSEIWSHFGRCWS